MDHISAILQGVLSGTGLGRGVANYAIFNQWDRVVGSPLAASTKPLRVQGDVLWVYVESSTLQHHLSFLVPQFLLRIRQEAPQSRIENIRFTLNPEQ